MKNIKNLSENLVSELAFELISSSEGIEGFGLDMNTVDVTGKMGKVHIDAKTILEFLENDYTKVSVQVEQEDDWECSYLIAHNSISNETIKIKGLADHYLALIDAVYSGNEMWKKRRVNPNEPLLTHDFIKHINLTHQRFRQDEVGIANYRKYRLDGMPHEVGIGLWSGDLLNRATGLQLARAEEVEGKMTELINWVNTVAFKDGRDIMRDIAEFHARFIQCHPFGDGNGRTSRLLTNYLLIALGQSMVTIPPEHKQEYYNVLSYAISDNLAVLASESEAFAKYLCDRFGLTEGTQATYYTINKYRTAENKYEPATEFFRAHQIHGMNAKQCVSKILHNHGTRDNKKMKINSGKLKANMVDTDDVNSI